MLSDSDVREMDLPPPDPTNPDDDFDADLLAAAVPRLLRAARVLEMLEAEERVPTTAAWAVVAAEALRKCGPGSPRPRPPLPLGMADAAVLVVSSTEYLLLKATYALENLGNYSLATVLAPLIALHGPYYERADFERKFGPIDFGGQGRGRGAAVPAMRWFIGVMTPITRLWVEQTVQQWCMGCSRKEAEVRKAELRASKERRVTALQTMGWAAGLDPRSQFVPEVLHRDAKCLRDMTSLMVMSNQGSLLTRYACKMAGVGDMVLWSESSSTADIAECREGLVAVFKQATTDEALKRGLSREVVRLARGEHGSSGVQSSNPGVISLGTAVHPQSDKPLAIAHRCPTSSPYSTPTVLKPNFSSKDEEILLATTSAVMTGKDPEFKLLGSRLRLVIIEMMEWVPVDSERVPPHMTIGGPLKLIPTFGSSGSSASNSGVTFSSLFLSAATEAFEKRGFAVRRS